MKTTTMKTAILLFLSLSFTACQFNMEGNGLRGQGKIIKKEFKIDKDFDKVATASVWNVELIQSDNPRLVVRTNKNIMPLFEYKVSGDKELSISSKKNIMKADQMEVKLYYKSLSGLKASSASDLTSREVFDQKDINISASSAADIDLRLKTKNCDVSASSASDVELSGTSINFNARASSSAAIDGEDLKTKNATVKASSAASIDVYATKSLKATSSSSGSIEYSGNPETTDLDQRNSGGTIEKDD